MISETRLTLVPRGRFDVFDVGPLVEEQERELRLRHRHTLYSSLHTTAGFLGPRLAARVAQHRDELAPFFHAFKLLFPPGGDYQHDQMHLRGELNDAQRQVEPRNGDSHLTFISSGMTNCVTYANQPTSPVYFIDLDGESHGTRRQRTARVVGYDREHVVDEKTLRIPVSRHPIDSINLADPGLGVLAEIEEMLTRSDVATGRVDIALPGDDRDAGLTVNEYETLLMRHDLAEVLRDPLRFAAQKGRQLVAAPLSIPGKTLNYAKYDIVHLLNALMEALRLDQSAVERLVARVMAVPAAWFLRSRRISFLTCSPAVDGGARLVRGVYQSPILVQWSSPREAERRIHVRLVQLS